MSERAKRLTAGTLVAVIAFGLTLAGMLWAASAKFSDVEHRARSNESRATDQEGRLRKIEERLSGVEANVGNIATDVRWIRASLGGQTRRNP